ncbi:MAG TPA: MMPL family transporter [Rhodocyclaceae bacterium]|nr:MMPL family transporter [Rhodocyclaceae bacterium]
MKGFWQTWQPRHGVVIWALLAAVLVIASCWRYSAGLPLQTNLLALLPSTERNPVAENAVNTLASTAGDRVIFLVGHTDFEQAAAAARKFAQFLAQDKAFSQVTAEVPAVNLRALTGLYASHRYTLLSSEDRQLLQSGGADMPARLQRKLYAPFQFGLTLPLAQDPFGLADQWLASLPLRSFKLEPDSGLLVRHTDSQHWVLVTAQLSGSAYDGRIQNEASQAITKAEAEFAGQNVSLLRTGTLFYAHAARAQGEREANWIGAGSLLGMLLLLYRVFRSVRPLVLGLLSVAFGIGTALLGVVCMHGEIHLITLVFGASLIGEAVDYSVQYFAAHMGAGEDWEPMAGLRRIAAGLCVALLTSLLGYAVLLFAPFPALHQIALFAMFGLTSAWLTVFLLLPACLRQPSRRNPDEAVATPQRWLHTWQEVMTPKRSILLCGVLLLLSIPGWLRLSGDDDIRQLITRPPELNEQESRIRELTGFANSSQFFVSEGTTPEALLQAEEALGTRLETARTRGDITGYQAVSAFVPSARRQAENYALLLQQLFSPPQKLRRWFDEAGLEDTVATDQANAFKLAKDQQLTVAEWLQAPLSTPFRYLWIGETAQGYAAIVMPQGVRDATTLSRLAEGLPGITYVDKAGSVSALFREYRKWGAIWLGGALVLVFAVLRLRYGWRDATLVFVPTLLSFAVTLAIFGWIGRPLTLFNLMGMMLLLGIGVNYSVFLREGGVNAAATLAGVGLSAGTTLLSFGLLAFSSMPALAGFGMTLLTGIAIAVLLSPLGYSNRSAT